MKRRAILRVNSAVVAVLLTLEAAALARAAGEESIACGIQPTHLRCEYRVNPLGIDVASPRLSWVLESKLRNQVQFGYQILVATQPDKLTLADADLWNSGRVDSDQTIHVSYDGRPLQSGQRCYWTLRVWDTKGTASAWSEPAMWSMGLLDQSDWGADWIHLDRGLHRESAAEEESRSLRIGYASEPAVSPDQEKWVAIDLGASRTIDAIQLHPARRFLREFGALKFINYDVGYLFPKRFVIEVANRSDFSDARTIVDHSHADEPNPGTDAPRYRCQPTNGRYVRLRITKLRSYAAAIHGVTLAELRVFSGEENVARGRRVTASDAVAAPEYSTEYLVDGRLESDDPIPHRPAVMARHEFQLEAPIQHATVYVTALGLYQLHINGRRVGDQLLAPEWTCYEKRVQYQAYDVTDLLREGKNAIGAVLGEGWYAGRVLTKPGIPDEEPKLLLRLEVRLANGQTHGVITDGSWRASDEGPIRFSSIYDGEVYDARQELPGWDQPDYDDSKWRPVATMSIDQRKLVWQPSEPIRPFVELKTERVIESRPGVYVFDLGQNMVGSVRLQVKGPEGVTLRLRHGERLNPDNSLFYNLKGGLSEITYTLRGDPAGEVYEPHFTYMGFRYVQVSGLPSPPTADTVSGRVFHSASPEVGQFTCSSPLLNQLMSNIVWTHRGNLMGIPTDCPQRDERLGWMGDVQILSGTIPYLMDTAAFFTKWVRDTRDSQADDGRFADTSPQMYGLDAFYGSAAWGDAGVICPWRMYQFYGDQRMLAEHYDAAKRWVDWIHEASPDLIWQAGPFPGDWLNGDGVFFDGYPQTGANIPGPEFGTAFFAHSTELLAKMASVLGRDADAKFYRQLFADIKSAYNRNFVSPDGRIASNTQGSYALALHFDLLPDELRPKAVQHLLRAFEPYDGHLSTGIQATHRLMLELTRYGHHDLACQLLNLRTPPSWGYMIDQGATTVWERWDGWVDGRDTHPGFMGWMNSFNHCAFGAVGEWMWRHLAGINIDESAPAFKHFVIRPRPGGGLTWAKAEYHSIRGTIASAWGIEQGEMKLQVTIPPNTTATVYVPVHGAAAVQESGVSAERADGVTFLRHEPGAAVYEVASGTYVFTAPY